MENGHTGTLQLRTTTLTAGDHKIAAWYAEHQGAGVGSFIAPPDSPRQKHGVRERERQRSAICRCGAILQVKGYGD